MKNVEKYTTVKTHKIWLTYLMFEITKKRITDQAWSYKKSLGGKNTATASASETITGSDIFCLIAIVKFIFDNQEKAIPSPINHANGKKEMLLSIQTTLNFFLHHYLNHKNKAELIKTIERLRTYQVSFNFYETVGKKEVFNSHSEHYLRSGDIEGEDVTFTISEALFQIVDTDGWTINYGRLSELMGVSQALYMYLTQNSGNEFTQAFFEQRLKLTEESKKNRDAIKAALTQLLVRQDTDPPEVKRIGYLKSFTVVKRGKGDYSFVIERVGKVEKGKSK